MTDTKTDRAGKDGQLIDEKRMKDMAVAPGEPGGADKARHESARREKGEAPTRADDDGMAQPGKQADKDELKDADRDDENLDEGLEESMDASDPPSSIQP